MQTIPLTHVAAKRLFVAAEDHKTVEVIDLRAGKFARSVRGLHEPKWIVYRPESHRIYVSNGGDSTCRAFDSRSFTCLQAGL